MSDTTTKSNQLAAMDWQSIQDQREWFDRFKIEHNGLWGLNLKQFQEFLNSSLYTYLAQVIDSKGLPTTEGVRFDPDQELQLFKHFDFKNDNLLDVDEFAILCQNWLHKIYRRKSALVVVDVQNDFIDGSLALIKSPAEQDGAEVVPVINKLLDENLFDTVVYTQDWHPSDHIGFHDNLHLRKYTCKQSASKADGGQDTDVNQNASTSAIETGSRSTAFSKLTKLSTKVKVFDTVLFDEGRMEQILWPRHCVQGSWGAELHPKLKVTQNSIRILKGTLSHVDAYSAFWDNLRLNETSLRDELTSRGITDVFFCGLAYDYCVAASALDSRKANFMTYVIEDACRGINNNSIKEMTNDMVDNDILIVTTVSTCGYLAATRNSVHYESPRVQNDNDNRRCHRIQAKHDGVAVNDAGSYKMRSDDVRDMLVAACFKKAFIHVQ